MAAMVSEQYRWWFSMTDRKDEKKPKTDRREIFDRDSETWIEVADDDYRIGTRPAIMILADLEIE